MKRNNKFLFLLTVIMTMNFGILEANALGISIRCNDVTVGENTTCTASTTGEQITSITGSYSISGANVVSVQNQNNWQGGNLLLYRGDPTSGAFAVFTISTSSPGTGKLTVTMTSHGDSDFNEVPGTISGTGTFNIRATTTTTTTTTTQAPTTKRTTRAGRAASTQVIATTTGAPETTTTQNLLYLLSVTVDDFEVKEQNGIYYVTVNPETEKVTVNATAPEGITIVGTGEKNLNEGTNTVTLILRDTNGGTATHSVIITRPGTGTHDTSLVNLDVVNYDLIPDFEPGKLEYTVSIPFNVKEVYILAESNSSDVVITGAGTHDMKDANAYITVAYGQTGDSNSTTYTIHFKKDYKVVILFGGISGIGLLLFILLIVNKVRTKSKVEQKVQVKAKEMAENNRINNSSVQLKVNGTSAVSVGSRIVRPTPVNEIKRDEKVVNSKSAPVGYYPKTYGNTTETITESKPQVVVHDNKEYNNSYNTDKNINHEESKEVD